MERYPLAWLNSWFVAFIAMKFNIFHLVNFIKQVGKLFTYSFHICWQRILKWLGWYPDLRRVGILVVYNSFPRPLLSFLQLFCIWSLCNMPTFLCLFFSFIREISCTLYLVCAKQVKGVVWKSDLIKLDPRCVNQHGKMLSIESYVWFVVFLLQGVSLRWIHTCNHYLHSVLDLFGMLLLFFFLNVGFRITKKKERKKS